MAVVLNGTRPQKRKGRPTLSPLDPFTETLLAGLGISKDRINEMRAFAKYWQRQRNLWDIARRKGGLFGSKLIKKHEADDALRCELERAKGGDE